MLKKSLALKISKKGLKCIEIFACPKRRFSAGNCLSKRQAA